MASLDYKMYDIMDDLSKYNRWDFLTVLILRANKRNRCWPAMRTIAKKAFPGKTKISAGNLGMATRAKNWLMEHGAVTLVKPEHRIGAEKKLPRNRHVYQLTGVIVIDKKVYPYLYSPGGQHVSGDETIGHEDVSGAETSGGEISGDEISGDETNHSSVVSSISSNQESGSDSSSSSDDDNFDLTDKERSIVLDAFGAINARAKGCLRKNRDLTLLWAAYMPPFNRCHYDDEKFVKNVQQWIWTCVGNGSPPPEIPIETAQHKKERESHEAFAKMSDDEKAAKLADDEAADDESVSLQYKQRQSRAALLQSIRDGVVVSANVTAEVQKKWDDYCKPVCFANVCKDMILVDYPDNSSHMIVVLLDMGIQRSVMFSNFVSGGLFIALGKRARFIDNATWKGMVVKNE